MSTLYDNRVTDIRFEMLDTDEHLVETLTNVHVGGSLSWDAYASVKGGGQLTMSDLTLVDYDWLNVRIRPVLTLESVDGSKSAQEFPLGVYLCAAPKEQWSATGREWAVELTDKLAIPDQDTAGIENGVPRSYTVPAGSNVLATVAALLQETGEATPAITPAAAVTSAPLVWEVGTSRLKIINDLLDLGDYFSLFCDGAGQFRAEPYVLPRYRSPVYSLDAPFSASEVSLMAPDWQRDRDIYGVPNRFVVIGNGTGETEAMVGVAVNDNESSPFSYQARGRWITRVESGVEAAGQLALNSIAARRLSDATSVATSISVKHAYLPDLTINSVVRFTNPYANLDIHCTVLKTTVPLSPIELCTSEMRMVL